MSFNNQQILKDLKNWKQFIKPYTKSENKIARKQIYNSFIPFIGLFILAFILFDYSVWLSVVVSLGNGLYLTRIFILQHDCGHQSFFETKKQNNILGFICSFFTLIPYKYWARSHNHHHAFQGQLDTRTIGDITLLTTREFAQLSYWKKFQYRIYRSIPVIFFVGPLYYIFVHNRLPLISLKGWQKEKKSLLLTNFYLLSFYLVLGYFLGYEKLLILYLSTIIAFATVAIWFFYIQHQHDPNYKAWKSEWEFILAAIKGSSYYKIPRIMNFFTGNIGYHHLHHLSPKIPFYKLPKCSKENPIFQKYVTTITFWKSLKYAFYTLWDEETNKMITFSQFRKLQKIRVSSIQIHPSNKK